MTTTSPMEHLVTLSRRSSLWAVLAALLFHLGWLWSGADWVVYGLGGILLLTGVVRLLLRPRGTEQIHATAATITGCAVLLSMLSGWLGLIGILVIAVYLGRY